MAINLKPYLKLARINNWRGYFLGGIFGFLLAEGWRAPVLDIICLPVIGILLFTFGFSINDFFDIKGDKFKNCLLYTSPSPRDLSTSRMPSSA